MKSLENVKKLFSFQHLKANLMVDYTSVMTQPFNWPNVIIRAWQGGTVKKNWANKFLDYNVFSVVKICVNGYTLIL